ncbi:unnamed protein product [Blepharisma stoltei]|uniref:C2H2-type domain-containing protein n=1 Tax=Blepharisma stoltei TaxID=1481888 RepID=A0AAU9K3K2_9CILI|nr:unnamed protein product [Blepharisma stoltei]
MEDKVFNCYYEFCNKVYKTKYTLARHINSEHLKIGTLSNKTNQKEESAISNGIDIRPSKAQINSVGSFLLSQHIKDTSNLNINIQTMPGTLPVLPLVDNSRKICPTDIKLPVMLHLLRSTE